jgi:hypothetical protein
MKSIPEALEEPSHFSLQSLATAEERRLLIDISKCKDMI